MTMPTKLSDTDVPEVTKRGRKRQAPKSKTKSNTNEKTKVTGSKAMDHPHTEKGKELMAPPVQKRELKIRRIPLLKRKTVIGGAVLGMKSTPEISNNPAAEPTTLSGKMTIRFPESTSNKGVATERREEYSTPCVLKPGLKIREIHLLKRKIRIEETAVGAAMAPGNSRTSVAETGAVSCRPSTSNSGSVVKKATVTDEGDKLWTPCTRAQGKSRLKIRRICSVNETMQIGETAEHLLSIPENHNSRASAAGIEPEASFSVNSAANIELSSGMPEKAGLGPTTYIKNDEAGEKTKFGNQAVHEETEKHDKQGKKLNNWRKNRRQKDKLKQRIRDLEKTLQTVQNFAPQNFFPGPSSIRAPYNISPAMQSIPTRQFTTTPSPLTWISPPMVTSSHLLPENLQGRSIVSIFPPTTNSWVPSQQSAGIQGALWQPTTTRQIFDFLALDQQPYLFY